MWEITPAYLQCRRIIIQDSFTSQFPPTDEHLTFKYPSALILYGTEQKKVCLDYIEKLHWVLSDQMLVYFSKCKLI